jgi:hypothetical protein
LRILEGGHALELLQQILHLSGKLRTIAKLHAQSAQVALRIAGHLIGNPAIMRQSGVAILAYRPALPRIVAPGLVAWLISRLLPVLPLLALCLLTLLPGLALLSGL